MTSLFLMILLLFPTDLSLAKTLGNSFSIGIECTKTVTVRPFEPQERDILSIYNVIYESLVVIDDDYIPQGCLARSWENSIDGKVWTFHLREDVTFSDGTPLTADDVVASARYILEKAGDENISDHGFYRNLDYFVKSITAKDSTTVSVTAKTTKSASRSYFGILYAMTFPVVPASQVSADFPLGSGPYVISRFEAGSFMTLAANPNWWQTQPYVNEITVAFRDSPKAVIDDYEYDRENAVFTRSIAGAQYKSGTSSFSISYRTNQLECLLTNNSVSKLPIEIRKAIRCVIDRQKIISTVYSDMAVLTNFPFYPGTWMYNSSLDSQFSVNLDEARRLLAEAGWEDTDENKIVDKPGEDGEPQDLILKFYVYEEPDNDVRIKSANMIAEQLAAVGIGTRIEAMTMANVREKLRAGSFDLALVSFALDVCPDPGFFLIKGNSANYVRYKSDRMTSLCQELRKQVTQNDYRQKLMEIQNLFAEDCPFICLYFRNGFVLSRFMYTTCRDVREYELLRGLASFTPN